MGSILTIGCIPYQTSLTPVDETGCVSIESPSDLYDMYMNAIITPPFSLIFFFILTLGTMNTSELQKKRRRDIIISSSVATTLGATVVVLNSIPKQPTYVADKDVLRNILLTRLYTGKEIDCFNQLRMGKTPFNELCNIPRAKGYVCDTIYFDQRSCCFIFIHIRAQRKVSSCWTYIYAFD
ncbi:hypothetical protein KSP40_PGU017630 [Platanthera guangdongensis]|uniref:Uncharacterized protein n=1 Tax=Platanthera guangdongensis TaxID=2320717 RepID=A0ABR2N0R4_9ASPA